MNRQKAFPVLLSLVITLALVFYGVRGLQAQSDAPRQVKTLTIAMFEVGEMSGDFAGEAQFWVEGEGLNEMIEVPGSWSPVYCNADDHCLVVTGMGIANATATLMAVGLSGKFDLSQTYILVAGIAGVDPQDGTLGSAAWADWVIDGDLAHEIDAREIPEGWDFPYLHLGCDASWCEEGWAAETEVYQLNTALVDWAYALSKDVELADSEGAQAYRANYPADWPASAPPSVIRCDTIAASTYWHGDLLGKWADWWASQWSGAQANYCMTEMEDSGTLTALTRLAKAGLVDMNRVLVLRTASNFDRPYPGQTAVESLAADSGGFVPSTQNAYLAGSAVTDYIIANWDTWQAGVPPLE
jgi:purine nucleoside permease